MNHGPKRGRPENPKTSDKNRPETSAVQGPSADQERKRKLTQKNDFTNSELNKNESSLLPRKLENFIYKTEQDL
jgi:hypothetical protein